MDKDILKRKLHLQKVRNCLANLKGVEVVRFCGNDEHEKIYSIEQKYFPDIYFLVKTPDSIINIRTPEVKLIEWIESQTEIQSHVNYYFRCSGVWVEIQITERKVGIESLWKHAHYFGRKHSYGFILVDEQMENMIDVGFDSRDEYNFYYDRYLLSTV